MGPIPTFATGLSASVPASRSVSLTRSEAGITPTLRAIGCRALGTKIIRGPVIVGEGAGFRPRAIIVRIADGIGQSKSITVPMVVVPARLSRARNRYQRSQGGRARANLGRIIRDLRGTNPHILGQPGPHLQVNPTKPAKNWPQPPGILGFRHA